MRAEAAALEARAQTLSQERQDLALKVAATEQALADESQRLDSVRDANAAQQAEWNRLRERQDALKRDLQQAGRRDPVTQDRAEIDRLS